MPHDHRKLRVFNAADALAMRVYEVTTRFPHEETYGLRAQVRRAALSVPTNIVEGAARAGNKNFAYFLGVAYGSLKELEYLLSFAQRLNHIPTQTYNELSNDITNTIRMLSAFRDVILKR